MVRDGDALTAASITSDLSDLVTAYNAVTSDDIAPFGLNREVLPGASFSAVFNQLTAMSSEDTYEVYNFNLPGVLGSIDFDTISTDGGSSYGPGVGQNWRIIAYDNDLTKAAEIHLITASALDGSDGLAAIVVHASVEVGLLSAEAGLETMYRDCVHLAIGIKDGDDVRYIIKDSICSYSKVAVGRGALPCQWLITAATLLELDAPSVKSIFVVVATRACYSQDDTGDDVEVGKYVLSVEPLRSGEM